MDSSILFFQPSSKLHPYINNYYIADLYGYPESENFIHKHISNGCVEMLLTFNGTRGRILNNEGNKLLTESVIVGAHSLESDNKGLALDQGDKQLRFISINFKPNGFFSTFKVPESEIHNSFVDTFCLVGWCLRIVQVELESAKNNFERIKAIEKFLVKNISRNQSHNYNIVSGIRIAASVNLLKGKIKLPTLAQEFNYSERTLERNFRFAFGFSIKEYCKIVSLNCLLNHLSHYDDSDWVDLVSQYGYYDQSHMINEFRSATGITPATFLKRINKTVFIISNHLAIIESENLYEKVRDSLVTASKSSSEATFNS
jgi:AraC-like DNA-binding protein